MCFQTNFLYGKKKLVDSCYSNTLAIILFTVIVVDRRRLCYASGFAQHPHESPVNTELQHSDYEHDYKFCFCVSSGMALLRNFVCFLQVDCSKMSYIFLKSSTGGARG